MTDPFRGVALAAVMLVAPAPVLAQAQVPAATGDGAARVLSVAGVQGAVTLERNGRAQVPQPGFLVFAGDRLGLGPGSHANLQLGSHGAIALAAPADGEAALRFDRLPLSTWATDLDIRVRLEQGAMRVSWHLPGDAADWPGMVLIDRWSARMGPGDFLYRRDARGTAVCKLRGALAVNDPVADWREELADGQCLLLGAADAPQRTQVSALDWRELEPGASVAEAPTADPDRSLAAPVPAPTRASRIVPPPPPPLAVVPRESDALERVPATVGVAVRPSTLDPRTLEAASVPPAVAPPPAAAAPVPAAPDSAAVPAPRQPALERAPATVGVAMRPSTVLEPVARGGVQPRLTLSPALTRVPQVLPAAGPAPAPSPAAPASAPEAGTEAEAAVAVPAPPLTPSAPLPPPVSLRPLSGEPPSLAEPVAPVIAPGLAPPASGNPEWIVNVMTVTDPKVANEHLAELARLGYPALLRQEVVRGHASYRIVINGIGSEQGARRTAQLLAGKGYPGAWPLQKR